MEYMAEDFLVQVLSIALINPDKKEEIAHKVRKEYIKRHPNLEKDFAIYFVNTADGIKL